MPVSSAVLPTLRGGTGAVRARIAHSLPDGQLAHWEDGVLSFKDGRIDSVGDACEAPRGGEVYDLRPALVVPEYVDTHVHYVQTDMIASYGASLLEWLERYAFPAEMAFSDPVHAGAVAGYFKETGRDVTPGGEEVAAKADAVFIGAIGLPSCAEIGDHNGLFQPAHGSAPDIAGQDKANPLAANRLRPMEFGGDMGTKAVTKEMIALVAEAS